MSDAKAETQVMLTVPKDVIDANVKAAVVRALGADPEKLVRAVVDAAMHEKNRNGYSTDPTIWDATVNTMIREVAQQSMKEWIEEQRPKIRASIRQRLDAGKGKVVAALVDKIVDTLTTHIRIDLSITDGR